MAKTDPKSKRERRHRRVRAEISGTAERPRLSVFRSNKHIYVQLIDDVADKTLFGLSDGSLPAAAKTEKFSAKVAKSFLVGEELAKQALVKKIKEVVFDRGGYVYAGRVKALAEGARRGGLKF